jgi:acid phosphatase (class A)
MRPFEFHGAHLLDPNDDGSGYVNTSSYPSGHAGFGWNIALMLIEAHRGSLSDVKKIITRAFQFGQSRTIGRYHWQADVIHGCVVSTCCLPRLHGYTQYLTLLSQA